MHNSLASSLCCQQKSGCFIGSQGKHSKDPRMGGCGTVVLIEVEVNTKAIPG